MDQVEENWDWDNSGILPYGWAGEYSNANTIGFDKHYELYRNMVRWIHDNISNCERNVCWAKIGDCLYFQFRKEKDMAFFLLRWA